jgi:hypothetical protein
VGEDDGGVCVCIDTNTPTTGKTCIGNDNSICSFFCVDGSIPNTIAAFKHNLAVERGTSSVGYIAEAEGRRVCQSLVDTLDRITLDVNGSCFLCGYRVDCCKSGGSKHG